jgi:hypothetical protein
MSQVYYAEARVFPADPEPPRLTPYLDPAGRPRAQVDFPIPENPSNPGLVILGLLAVIGGVGLIALGSRRSPEPAPTPGPVLGWEALPT